MIATWNSAKDGGNSHRQWTTDLSKALAPSSFLGGYANLLGPNEQISHAYGSDADCQRQVKKQFDPNGIFMAPVHCLSNDFTTSGSHMRAGTLDNESPAAIVSATSFLKDAQGPITREACMCMESSNDGIPDAPIALIGTGLTGSTSC